MPGQKHVFPHLLIPEVMPIPQRFYSANAQRRSLRLAVAICLAGGVYVKALTGTEYDGYQADKQYLKEDSSKPYSGMGSEEYLDVLKGAVAHFEMQRAFRSRRELAMLVHDRSRVHTSAKVKRGLTEMHLSDVVQPARSPDLQPLDYGIFGTAKAQLDRQLSRNSPWTDRAERFVQLLSEARIEAVIQEFPIRLQACINARGHHIDRTLPELKRKAHRT